MQYFPKFSGIQIYTDYKHSIQVNILCFLLYGQLVLPHVAPTGEKKQKQPSKIICQYHLTQVHYTH